MAKDRTPARTGATGSRAKGGRTRPVTDVVAPQRPWGLIAGALVVVLFAAAVITYAVVKVNEANANKVESPDDISGMQTYDYAAGQEHVTTPVDYSETPPVGGPHDGFWADCTGSVYDVDIRHENAVHALEHGAVWITYDPEALSDAQIATLADLVDGVSGRMMSPFAGQDSPISVQSWNHQLKVDSPDDERIKQFADLMTRNPDFHPEVGASCENPDFLADPLVAGDESTAVGQSDMATTPTPDATETTGP